jgi:hypothetical protein
MAEPDWRALYAQLMDAVGTSGGQYEGAPYSSKDPQRPRMMEGQVDPDVGWLDPVDLLAGTLGGGLQHALTPAYRRSVPSSMVRLYRGETTKPPAARPEWITQAPAYQEMRQAAGRWWTNEPGIADWYVRESLPDARLVWQDVPTAIARQSHLPQQATKVQQFSLDPQHEWFLPPAYAGKGRPMPTGPGAQRRRPQPAASLDRTIATLQALLARLQGGGTP